MKFDINDASCPSTLRSLHTISSYPTNPSLPVLAQYPAMKLGIKSAIEYYAEKLLPLARRSVESNPGIADWVITAPLFISAPAGANLLCWEIFPRLKDAMPRGKSLSTIDLHVEENRMKIDTAEDFKTHFEYSGNSVEQRVKNRDLIHGGSDDIVRNEAAFRGRGVIVINDIRVTGTQQDYMYQSFRQVGPVALEWIYIVEVETEIGSRFPHIEAEINGSALNTLESFGNAISSGEIRYTARCISRLFRHEPDEFEYLVQRLSEQQRKTIVAIAANEKYYEGGYFKAKFELLRDLAQQS